MSIDKYALDRHITGNWGEDSIPDELNEVEAVDKLAEVMWKHEIVMFRIHGMSWDRVASAKETDPGMTQWCAMREDMRARARAVLQYLFDCGVL